MAGGGRPQFTTLWASPGCPSPGTSAVFSRASDERQRATVPSYDGVSAVTQQLLLRFIGWKQVTNPAHTQGEGN